MPQSGCSALHGKKKKKKKNRYENKNKDQSTKKLANNIKASVIKNVIENAANQSDKDTLVEYVPAFDFK